jgi:hypothetical protein
VAHLAASTMNGFRMHPNDPRQAFDKNGVPIKWGGRPGHVRGASLVAIISFSFLYSTQSIMFLKIFNPNIPRRAMITSRE